MFNKFMYLYITVSILVCILFVPVLYCYNFNSIDTPGYSESFDIISSKFVWPIPGYTYISSYFGKRTSPTAGASSYHSGLDIPAPEGTYLFAVDDGYISFASWGAGGGYTIVLNSTNFPDFSFSYCHVSPTMFVSVGDTVNQNNALEWLVLKMFMALTIIHIKTQMVIQLMVQQLVVIYILVLNLLVMLLILLISIQ